MPIKNKRSLEDTRGLNVDKRSDTTRHGYHEGVASSAQSHSYHPFLDMINEVDRRTNMTREDSPIYHPYLVTGEAPSPGLKGAQGVMAVKQANAARVAKNKGLVRSMKEAVKASGKSYSPALRGNNKAYNYNAITANDVFNESKIISGSGVYAKPKPKFTPKPSTGPNLYDLDAGQDFIKTNKLTSFKASNGKEYVKLPDGTIKSVGSIGQKIRAKDEDFINYLRSL